MRSQIQQEVLSTLQFIHFVYQIFGMQFKLQLSTKPKKALGDDELWTLAETEMAAALDTFTESVGMSWTVNPGDGAFYGPKIDIKVTDSLRRTWQCATVQLDFQLPIRFKLEYKSPVEGVVERPVIVHRAILGSVERMMAMLTEHYGGKFPFWLSARQGVVVPLHEAQYGYAEAVQARLHSEGFEVECDLSSKTFGRKLRDAQMTNYNFMIVVGPSEAANSTVNLRFRNEWSIKDLTTHIEGGQFPLALDDAAAFFKQLSDPTSVESRDLAANGGVGTLQTFLRSTGACAAALDLASLNSGLEGALYLKGQDVPSMKDAGVFAELKKAGVEEISAAYPHARRWFADIGSYAPFVRKSWGKPEKK